MLFQAWKAQEVNGCQTMETPELSDPDFWLRQAMPDFGLRRPCAAFKFAVELSCPDIG